MGKAEAQPYLNFCKVFTFSCLAHLLLHNCYHESKGCVEEVGMLRFNHLFIFKRYGGAVQNLTLKRIKNRLYSFTRTDFSYSKAKNTPLPFTLAWPQLLFLFFFFCTALGGILKDKKIN